MIHTMAGEFIAACSDASITLNMQKIMKDKTSFGVWCNFSDDISEALA
jgi:hypothetical protein